MISIPLSWKALKFRLGCGVLLAFIPIFFMSVADAVSKSPTYKRVVDFFSKAPEQKATPASSQATPEPTSKKAASPDTEAEGEADRAKLSVQVPANAEVWLEGRLSRQTGPSRLFRTPPLEQGTEYDYEIRARWLAENQIVDTTRRVKIRAGGNTRVDFSRPAVSEP
jgi:uncharacterized protein (TIGR03000 family)